MCWSFIQETLRAGDYADNDAEQIIKNPDENGKQSRDEDNHKGVCYRRARGGPNDVRKLIAHVLQIREG